MSRKTRYILIAIGFLIFLCLAPAIVLYVRGINYDYSTGKFFRTGILAVRSEPGDAMVELSGKVVRKKSGDIKFLKPGAYDISVSAQSFRPWSKRLSVWADEVTWASPAPNKIFLFLQDNPTTELGTEVADFTVAGNNLLSVSSSGLTLSTFDKPEQSQNFSLPENMTNITAAPNNEYFLLTSTSSPANFVFDKREQKIYNLTTLFPAGGVFAFSDKNILYGQSGEQFYAIDWKNSKKTLLNSKTKAFTVLGDTAYILEDTSSGAVLSTFELPNQTHQVLAINLPSFSSGKIFINEQKQIFLLLDQSFYHVNSGLQKLADNVSDFYFNPKESNFVLVHAGELSEVNFNRGSLQFITRSSQNIISPRVNYFTSYSFFFKDNELMAAELDTRDKQNQYVLYTATNPQKLYVDDEGKNLTVLDNGVLKEVKIRK